MFSFNKLLTDNTWSLEQATEFCASLGFDAIDPTGYYFKGYPEVPTDQYIYSLKRLAFDHGLAISGTGIRNDFALSNKNDRKENIELTKRWIEVAAKLDAPVIRVFVGKQIPEGHSIDDVKEWVVESVLECIEFGSSHGVIITLQNHFDALKSKEDIKSVLDSIDSPWFGLNLDIGSLRLGDPYQDIEALIPYAKTWQIKEKVFRNNVEEMTDIPKLMALIKNGGYRGYIPVETLSPSDPRERLGPFLKEIEEAISH